MDGYSSEITFYLPEIFERSAFSMYSILLKLYSTLRDVFYDNIKIGAVYDSPSGCIWNGGRSNQKRVPIDIIEVKELLESFDIPMRLTFTNSVVEEKHLENEFCNYILDEFCTGKNEIIVASELLKNYITSKCGNKYKYISSTTKCILEKEDLEKEANKYYLTVLDFRLNKSFDILSSLNNKAKFELLLNEACNFDCKFRKQCYEGISKMNISGIGIYGEDEIGQKRLTSFCNPEFSLDFSREMSQPMFISNEDIERIYIPMGFRHFKINGRKFPTESILESLIYYLIKDKYKIPVRESIILNRPQILFDFMKSKFS